LTAIFLSPFDVVGRRNLPTTMPMI